MAWAWIVSREEKKNKTGIFFVWYYHYGNNTTTASWWFAWKGNFNSDGKGEQRPLWLTCVHEQRIRLNSFLVSVFVACKYEVLQHIYHSRWQNTCRRRFPWLGSAFRGKRSIGRALMTTSISIKTRWRTAHKKCLKEEENREVWACFLEEKFFWSMEKKHVCWRLQ